MAAGSDQQRTRAEFTRDGNQGALARAVCRTVKVIAGAVLITSCSALPCESYGVRDDGQSWTVRETHAVSQSEVNEACKRITKPDHYEYAGCFKFVFNDIKAMDLWWVRGDECAEHHERSHANCGLHHTDRYNRDIANGHPRPACPP